MSAGDKNLLDKLRDFLTGRGAALVGVADLRGLDEDVNHGYPVGVSIARMLDPDIIRQIVAGPTQAYCDEYDRANAQLTALSEAGAGWLRQRGYGADETPASGTFDGKRLRASLQHKTLARLAGLGWIGRCALLITPQFGSGVRLGSILTDAPLPAGKPIDESRCDDCEICVRVCPGSAPSGREYRPGMQREDFFDAHACRAGMKTIQADRGIAHEICGLCIANCPWTIRWLEACD